MKIGKCDIKHKWKKDSLFQFACKSVGIVASTPKFKQILVEEEALLKKKMMDLFKLPSFRKDVVEVMTI